MRIDRLDLVHEIVNAVKTADGGDQRSRNACSAAITMFEIQQRNNGDGPALTEVVKHLMSVVGKSAGVTIREAELLARRIVNEGCSEWTQEQVREIARVFTVGTDDKMWMYIAVLQKYTTQIKDHMLDHLQETHHEVPSSYWEDRRQEREEADRIVREIWRRQEREEADRRVEDDT